MVCGNFSFYYILRSISSYEKHSLKFKPAEEFKRVKFTFFFVDSLNVMMQVS